MQTWCSTGVISLIQCDNSHVTFYHGKSFNHFHTSYVLQEQAKEKSKLWISFFKFISVGTVALYVHEHFDTCSCRKGWSSLLLATDISQFPTFLSVTVCAMHVLDHWSVEPFQFLESGKARLEGWGEECRGHQFGFQLGQFFDLTAAVQPLVLAQWWCLEWAWWWLCIFSSSMDLCESGHVTMAFMSFILHV